MDSMRQDWIAELKHCAALMTAWSTANIEDLRRAKSEGRDPFALSDHPRYADLTAALTQTINDEAAWLDQLAPLVHRVEINAHIAGTFVQLLRVVLDWCWCNGIETNPISTAYFVHAIYDAYGAIMRDTSGPLPPAEELMGNRLGARHLEALRRRLMVIQSDAEVEQALRLIERAQRWQEEHDSAAGNGGVAPLSKRKESILMAMLDREAIDDLSRRSADTIARDTDGTQGDVENFKKPLAELVANGYLEVKVGRNGGYWLTAKGKAEATRITEKL